MSESPHSVAEWITAARRAFMAAGLDDPATDARTLVSGILGLSPTQIVVESERVFGAEEAERLAAAIDRRVAREPVHRILGSRSFYGLELTLSPETLEPRPDTEILVDRMLAFLPVLAREGDVIRILDMGTGTGAIALSLLENCPGAVAVGSDISEDALATARRNAQLNGLSERFEGIRSDWFDAIVGDFDVIVSNPPYIRTDVIRELAPEVRLFDPMAALDGGDDGLTAYRAIASRAPAFLTDDGLVGVEIGYDQKTEVTKIFANEGFTLIDSAGDYGGQDRVLIFRRSAE